MCCPEEQCHHLCPFWNRSDLIFPGPLGTIDWLPIFLLLYLFSMNKYCLQSSVELLSVFSFCLYCCAVPQPTLSGEGLSCPSLPGSFDLWVLSLGWRDLSFGFIGHPIFRYMRLFCPCDSIACRCNPESPGGYI